MIYTHQGWISRTNQLTIKRLISPLYIRIMLREKRIRGAGVDPVLEALIRVVALPSMSTEVIQ